MRYLGAFVFVLALVTSPLTVGAQDTEDGARVAPDLQEPEPSTEPGPEEPALQLQLDNPGVDLAPTLRGGHYQKTQLRRARIGLAGSVIAFGGGVAMMGVGFANIEWGSNFCFFEPCPQTPTWAILLAVIGPLLAIGGLTGMILTGKRLARQKKRLRWYAGGPESHSSGSRRVQWDPVRSRLVF
jgi:hypothetical protein